MRGKKLVQATAGTAAVVGLLTAYVALVDSPEQTCAPRMTHADCLRVNPSYGKVVYVDGTIERFVVIEPGTGAPPVAFIEPPSLRPTVEQCGTKVSGNRWFALCPTTAQINRSWIWIGPPPLVPCTRFTQPRVQAGYSCGKGHASVAGWHGSWRPEVRP